MENLNQGERKMEFDQDKRENGESKGKDGSYHNDGDVTQSVSDGTQKLSDLEAQTKGSDADQDQTVKSDENDIDEQIKGSDSDYDEQSISGTEQSDEENNTNKNN